MNHVLGSYTQRIEAAAESAPLVPYSDTSAKQPVYYNFNFSPKWMPDDHPVEWNTNWRPTPGEALITDPQEYPALYEALGRVTGIVVGAAIGAFLQRHEAQHGRVGQMLGCEDIVFGVMLRRHAQFPGDIEGRLQFDEATTTCLNLKTTKLGLADLSVYPIDGLGTGPGSDLHFIKALGYDGVQDVGDRIIAHNANPANDRLLVPLSYGSQSNSWPGGREEIPRPFSRSVYTPPYDFCTYVQP